MSSQCRRPMLDSDDVGLDLGKDKDAEASGSRAG